jgi:hypothetical protein
MSVSATSHVDGATFFHVNGERPYSPHALLGPGDVISAGSSDNPFWAYYETPRTFPVRTPEVGKVEHVGARAWIRRVLNGTIVPDNLPQTANDIVEHFYLFGRELVMELVRREVAPNAPSRQKCLWMTESLAEAQYWAGKVGHGSIVELRATGEIHRADAALLMGEADAFSQISERARAYWKGEISDRPEVEILFAGRAEVVARHEV